MLKQAAQYIIKPNIQNLLPLIAISIDQHLAAFRIKMTSKNIFATSQNLESLSALVDFKCIIRNSYAC